MIPQFDGNTADELWRKAAIALMATVGDYTHQDSRLGPMREYLHCALHLRDPIQRWVLSRQPAINPAFAIAEVIWILSGRKDAAFVNHWNPLLPEFTGNGETYHGAYGHRIRYSFGFDQMERAYQVLSKNPSSRQVVLQIWDSRIDSPNPDGSAQALDIPCNIVGIPKIRNGKLEWLQIMRSNDIYLGTPHNFVQFTCLQEVLAGWLDIDVGEFVLVSDSLHLYEHDIDRCAITADRPLAVNTDSLRFSKAEFDRFFPKIESALNNLRAIDLAKDTFHKILDLSDVPKSWCNFLYIAAADSARRRGWSEEVKLASTRCTNPALNAAWRAWVERCASRQKKDNNTAKKTC